MICALTLTTLVFLDAVQIHHILWLSFAAGVAQAFGALVFQSMIPSLVPRSTLPNAVALNSIQFNLAQLIGPLIGGVVLASLGMVACFGLNGVSFLAVIVVLGFMHLPVPPAGTRQRITVELKGGLSFVRNERALLSLTVVAAATTTLGLPLRSFLPVFADDATHLSWMMAALGGGAVAGALTVAWLGQFQKMGLTLLAMQAIFGGLVATFAWLPITNISYVVLFLGGAALIMVFSLANSLVQLTVPNKLRGRVLSIYLVAFRAACRWEALSAATSSRDRPSRSSSPPTVYSWRVSPSIFLSGATAHGTCEGTARPAGAARGSGPRERQRGVWGASPN